MVPTIRFEIFLGVNFQRKYEKKPKVELTFFGSNRLAVLVHISVVVIAICIFALVLSALAQLLFELLDLLLILPKQSVFGIFVDGGVILDALGSRRVSKRAHRLVVVVIGWTDVGHHDRLGVAAQRVLEETGELGVAVRNVRALAVYQGRYDVAQSGEREIDLGCLLQSNACGSRLGLTLAAGQIDQVKLANADTLGAIGSLVTAFDGH